MKNFFEELTPSYTFEIFPPKGNKSTEGTYGVIDSLVSFNPDLISVTYGAGGSSLPGFRTGITLTVSRT